MNQPPNSRLEALFAWWASQDMMLRWTARVSLTVCRMYGKCSVAVDRIERSVFVPRGRGPSIAFPLEAMPVYNDDTKQGAPLIWRLLASAPITVVQIDLMRREKYAVHAEVVRAFDLREVVDDGSIGATEGAIQLSQGIWPVFFLERSQLWEKSCRRI